MALAEESDTDMKTDERPEDEALPPGRFLRWSRGIVRAATKQVGNDERHASPLAADRGQRLPPRALPAIAGGALTL